jgi:hypothetical protein
LLAPRCPWHNHNRKKTTRLLFSSSRVVSVRDTLPAPD